MEAQKTSPPGPAPDELQALATLLLRNNGIPFSRRESVVTKACEMNLLSYSVENDVPQGGPTTL